jgi:short-subunit dehydrogenase
MKLRDKTALITGAGSGIGRALAIHLAQKGCHMALADKDTEGLHETLRMLESHNIKTSGHLIDVSDRRSLPEFILDILKQHQQIHLVINNAGVAAGGTFLQMSEADFNRVMDINFHGLVNITRLLLPHLLQQAEARIVNISSLFGLVSPPEQTAYSASKFAVRGFSNALRFELQNTQIGVTVVHPGGVATQIVQNSTIPAGATETEIKQKMAENERLLRMPPPRAAEIIVRGIEKNKARILVGYDAKMVSVLERILPVSYWTILEKLSELRRNSPSFF